MSTRPTVTLIETLFSQTKEYVENRLELLKLKAVDKVSGLASTVLTGVVLFLVFFIFFIVFNIGLALLIGELLGHAYLGFLILAALYAIAGIIFFSKRNKLFKDPVIGMIIRKFL